MYIYRERAGAGWENPVVRNQSMYKPSQTHKDHVEN